MDVSIIALILFGSLILFILLGVPVAFGMGAISLVVGFIFWGGEASIQGFILGSYGKLLEFTLTALPLYLFMAGILRYSDLADDMYEAIYRWFGGVRGGLAAGTTLIGAIFAAMVGVTSVATATLGLTARPSMLKRGYDNRLTAGVIMAGGTLGIIIPPSILMIIYALEANVSAGKLFFAGIGPGILAALIFMVYALVMSYIRPELGPALKKEERYTLKEKFLSLKGVILPVLVIIGVLAAIFTGLATPTEAASVGVVGALVAAAIKRKLDLNNLKKMLAMTVSLSGMFLWLLISAVAYARIVSATGVGSWVAGMISDLDVNRWFILIGMHLIFLILGMFLDAGAILFITAPFFIPVASELGFDMVWFGILWILNMCIGSMTPPFGFSLFVLRGVAPDIKMKEIYMAVIPFCLLYIVVLALVMIFPDIALWLPSKMIE